ncbi:MAG: prepilin-type N-terminal cleavage/methylation domain-containing protein [Candidatus Eremiobacteraeota bacterium]|nr:prepilin-type N-terminal cleavage/methylation domain-containing protein [Candidatus Eremiobacteraeota bacterium]
MMKNKKGFTLIEMITVIAILALLMAIMFPHMWRLYAKSRYTVCISNLKNIANALQIYMTEHEKFPPSLEELTPDYISTIPKCPEANADTYTDGYEVDDENTRYTLCCKGSYHTILGYEEDEPFYSSEGGLNQGPASE